MSLENLLAYRNVPPRVWIDQPGFRADEGERDQENRH
jgi:hypothetical protein